MAATPKAKRPTKLITGHLTWEIRYLPDAEWPRDSLDKCGLTLPVPSQILVRLDGDGETMSEDNLREVTLHEVLHAIYHSTALNHYLRPGDDSDLEEYTVAMLSGPLLAVLRSNPELMSYLLGS